MNFVDDVDLHPTAARCVAHTFAKFADFVDAAIGGTIDFEDINGLSRGDFLAGITLITGCWRGAVLCLAIERFSEDTRRGSLAHTACTGKQERVGDTVLKDCVLQSPRDVFLANNFIKLFWSPLSGEHHIRHKGHL